MVTIHFWWGVGVPVFQIASSHGKRFMRLCWKHRQQSGMIVVYHVWIVNESSVRIKPDDLENQSGKWH